MLPIRWTLQALDDLDQITDYIAEYNPGAAKTIFEVIESAVIPASVTPYLFRTGREPGTREIVAHPNYLVVYRVMDGLIEVVNVIHARQRYPRE
ncbi:type II toxin-antitoxin system RelE/ParE family toxin [Caballeronia sp. LZ034LL]|uniref:type II toxin-antitoxin system RelE/ParE family toxin n=1 Tax=Caballeronia sp. LZ034LL TaxID=3038567 RepID=UPI00285F620A|nr:type II toxin-antitoxin system RelE/ParE family toxin [Caballeronia sp. LZ034LL]MDR5838602.1 type II toxin-antitoxin system RelE/ParE family toxin [Caballeronia sp. LZ034LL]